MQHFELAMLDFIQTHLRSEIGDVSMPLITALGNGGAVWILLAVVLLIIPRTRRVGMVVAAALVIEIFVCNGMIKPLAGRIRPCDVNTAVTLLIKHPVDPSFPSGHTGAGAAATAALYFANSRLWKPVGILAALIAFSRLYLYVHYPSDVLGGMLIGFAAGWAAEMLVRYIQSRKREKDS